MLHTTDGELGCLLDSPFAAEELFDPGGVVVASAPDGEVVREACLPRLRTLPCVVVGVGRGPVDRQAPWCDLVEEPGVGGLDDVCAVVEANPLAATALALLLRGSDGRSVADGLVAESAVYSMLQGGPEFARWRAGRAVRARPVERAPAVRLERDGARLDVVLHRPRVRNALDRSLRDGMLDGLATALADPSVTEVVLRGEGPSFSSGGDLDEFGSFPDPASAHLVRLTASIGRAIDELGERIEARVHGPCAGSGVELPAFAARVTAAPDFTATLPEVTLGLIPGAGGTVSLPRRIGRHRAALLALTAATIDAPTAAAWGLVDEIADPE